MATRLPLWPPSLAGVLLPLDDHLELPGDLWVQLDAGAVRAGLLYVGQGHHALVHDAPRLLLDGVHHLLGRHTAGDRLSGD